MTNNDVRFAPQSPAERPRERYHVALSFASEQRSYVDEVARGLAAAGVKYFYDSDNQAKLWGQYLPETLEPVFRADSDTVVIFISHEYVSKKWTKLERRAALSGAARAEGEYILPVRFDKAIELDGLSPDLIYIEAPPNPRELAARIVEKLTRLEKLTNRHRERINSMELASPRAQGLLPGPRSQFVVIDDAIVLCDIPRSASSADLTIALGGQPPADPTNRQWARLELEAALDGRAWDPRVVAHLRGKLPEGVDKESSGMKLGLRRIVRAAPDHGQPMALELEAWPWWVEREFNRSLLRSAPDSSDDRLAQSLAARLLTDDNDAGSYKLGFPGGFYIELAVVDRAGKVLLLGKSNKSGSHMAGAGMKWTCTIEEGTKLSDVIDGHLDPEAVALRGLREELGIQEADVDNVTFSMVALQSRHLNTALLGVATVKEPCDLLARRAAAREFYDFDDGDAITLRSARDKFDGAYGQQAPGTWHATARLRLHLAMVLHGLG